jgi:Na+/proline symporter
MNLEDFLTQRNSVGSWAGLSTVVASVAGSWILFAPGETGTWAGIVGLIGYALGQAAPLASMAFVGPRMKRLMPEGHSLTEYVWCRFGSGMYFLALLVIVFYMFVYLAAELTGISLAFRLIAGIPLWLSASIVALATVVYTSYGGIKATIFTDKIQFAIMLPLLALVFLILILELGGVHRGFNSDLIWDSQLLSFTNVPGIKFALTLLIAILAADMFHQGFWQRVYACKDSKTLSRVFLMSGIFVIPMVFLSGIFGVAAVGMGIPQGSASVALFWLILETVPSWVLILVIILALILVMSSMDTLLNGIVSTLTSDIHRLRPQIANPDLLRISRFATVILAFPAVFIASQGYSVLYLFLLADLFCAGCVFPVFYGLFNRRISGTIAIISCLSGTLAGALFFPKSNFSPWLNIPFGGDFLASFGVAIVISATTAIVCTRLRGISGKTTEFEFTELSQRIRLIQG